MRWSTEHGMTVRRIGAGPELVWIHGLGEQSASFDAVTREPALAGFTHVLPDLPGHGRSPWPAALPAPDARGALDDLAAHLAAWLAPRPPAVLIGHSLGGVLATLVGELAPVRAVVNIEGNLTLGDCTYSRWARRYDAATFVARGFAEMRDDVYEHGLEDRPLRGFHAALCAASPAVYHHLALDLVLASESNTLGARLVALRVPHLYIAGVPRGTCADSLAVLERIGARWVAFEPAGHWVFVEQPAAFAAAVASFVTGL